MAARPAFDVDAIEVEETGEPFVFKLGGKRYTVPSVVDFRIAARLREGDFAGAIELMVGPAQWQTLMDSTGVLTLPRATAIVQAWSDHIGSTAGKSRASTRSSKSTARPSKPTSNGSTRSGSRG